VQNHSKQGISARRKKGENIRTTGTMLLPKYDIYYKKPK
jgi:hypothetical protein